MTEIDLLITNMIIFSRLDASFPVKVAKNIKIKKKCQLTENIAIVLSDLVLELYSHSSASLGKHISVNLLVGLLVA